MRANGTSPALNRDLPCYPRTHGGRREAGEEATDALRLHLRRFTTFLDL